MSLAFYIRKSIFSNVLTQLNPTKTINEYACFTSTKP